MDDKIIRASTKKYLESNEKISHFCNDHGIPESSLRYWTQTMQAGIVNNMSNKHHKKWTAIEKFSAVLEYEKLSTDEEKGTWLRQQGIKLEHIDLWIRELKGQLEEKLVVKPTTNEKKKIKALEKELNRKDKGIL